MENAPLTTAYDHAKSAAIYQHKGSLNAARESHDNAAGDFAKAASNTHDNEAHRILRLLEEHHAQLAKALATSSSSNTILDEKDGYPTSPTKTHSLTSPSKRPPRRELSSSIASNLATARGKPSQRRPLPATTEVPVKRPSPPPSRSNSTSGIPQPLSSAPQPNSEAFASFFSNFENFFSKLSAPLAFTGLPLNVDDNDTLVSSPDLSKPSKSSSSRPSRRNPSTRATTAPDLSTLFSEPTIRAIREDNGPALVHESFYVVDPSYATVSRAQSDLEGSDNEFVDARESLTQGSQDLPSRGGTQHNNTQSSASQASLPRGDMVKKRGKGWAGNSTVTTGISPGGKTLEELELENGALRQLLDNQSKKLSMWEASSQSQSMALHKSILMNASRANSFAPVPESEKVKELEELMATERAEREVMEREMTRMQKENARLLAILGKYKEKWAVLKESARQREKRKEDERKASSSTNT